MKQKEFKGPNGTKCLPQKRLNGQKIKEKCIKCPTNPN